MPIKDIEIKTFERKYMCDEEGCTGEFIPTGVISLTMPACHTVPTWPHKCTKCGTEKIFDMKYPVMVYKHIEQV